MMRMLAAWVLLLLVLVSCDGAEDIYQAGDRAAAPDRLREPSPGARSITIEPTGTIYLEQPPRRFVAYQSIEAEIAIALGVGEGLVAMFDRPHLATLDRLFYRQVPGVGASLEDVRDLPFGEQVDLELFHGLEADAVLIDPRLPIAFWGWSPKEMARVAGQLGPFVGNFIRYPRDAGWGPRYRRYTIEQYSERLAQLFDRRSRWARLDRFRQQTIRRIQQQLPPAAERPAICVLNIGSQPDKGRFYLVEMADGARGRHYRDLGLSSVADRSAPGVGEHGVCDYETLAAIDPEVIIVQWAVTKLDDPEAFERRFVAPMRDHPIGRRIRAVRNGRVLPGGTGEQGPITHLFQLEMAAQQLFPETFGRWRWGATPERPLFDRSELARILSDDTMPTARESGPARSTP